MNLKWVMLTPMLMAILPSSCAPPIALRGNIPFKSEPISRIHVDQEWRNSSGKRLNGIATGTLYGALSQANLCRVNPGLASSLGGHLQIRASSSIQDNAGKKTRDWEFGDKDMWIEKEFGVPANCCRGEGDYRPDLCERKNKIDDETLILRPGLARLDENGFTVAMDVCLGSCKNAIGSVECSAEVKTPVDCIDVHLPKGPPFHKSKCDTRQIPYDSMAKCITKIVDRILIDYKR